ncbi:unnamed protein product [Closterium sp. Naga37s-1]|nr:unnamed protein product [Closterium sp. Naga37s-1]
MSVFPIALLPSLPVPPSLPLSLSPAVARACSSASRLRAAVNRSRQHHGGSSLCRSAAERLWNERHYKHIHFKVTLESTQKSPGFTVSSPSRSKVTLESTQKSPGFTVSSPARSKSLDHPGAFSPLPSALHFPLTLLSPSPPLASPLLPPSRLLPSPLHIPLTVLLPTPFPFPCAPLHSPLPSPPFLFLGNPRSISRGTAPAYTIRFSAAVAGADSPSSNLLLSLPRGALPLVLCRGSAECQWVATTPYVWEVAGERRMRGVDVRQARVLEEMLTAVGEGGGSGEDSAAVGEGSDAVAGYGVRAAAAAVEGGDEGQYDLVGALQRSREYSHDIIIPRYPPQDPRLEVRLEGGMGGMGEMGERGEMAEGLSGGVRGGAFMLGAFK